MVWLDQLQQYTFAADKNHMKKQVQIRSFGLRPTEEGMQEDLTTVNNYLRQAEIRQAFAVNGSGNEGSVLLFLEHVKEGKELNRSSVKEVVAVEQVVYTAEQSRRIDRIKSWRTTRAADSNLPVFMILPNLAIESIALDPPSTVTQLIALKGMGPIRAQRYGSEILELMAEK